VIRKRLKPTLSNAGRAAFAQMDAGTRAQMETILSPLGQDKQQRLISAMREIKTVLCGEKGLATTPTSPPPSRGRDMKEDCEKPSPSMGEGWVGVNAAITLRPLQVGDLGWITHRQAVLYAREYGWDWRYEGLVSGIMSRFWLRE
jgi:hypothetical protein